jgi:hypothetical protein
MDQTQEPSGNQQSQDDETQQQQGISGKSSSQGHISKGMTESPDTPLGTNTPTSQRNSEGGDGNAGTPVGST